LIHGGLFVQVRHKVVDVFPVYGEIEQILRRLIEL
jgi:hypothetical protein